MTTCRLFVVDRTLRNLHSRNCWGFHLGKEGGAGSSLLGTQYRSHLAEVEKGKAKMTRTEAVAIIAEANPSLTVQPERADATHLLAIENAAGGTTNYDLRTLDTELLRSLVTPKA